jgi:hypothetical protein
MIDKNSVLEIRSHLADLRPPVLSLYVEVNPARPYNARRAWDIRAKNSVKELGLPKTLEAVVFSAIEQELAPEARTLVIFAAVETYSKRVEMDVVRIPLHIDLPIVDLAHGRVEARWGEPHYAPLLYALDEYERVGVVWLRGEGWKFFEVFLGEIEEHTEVFREIEPEVWKELQAFDPGRVRSLAQARTSGSRDRFSQRMETAAYRYLKRLADLTERGVAAMEIHRLVLLGREESTKTFVQMLSRSMREMIVAQIADLPHPQASPATVLEKVLPVLTQVEREQELALLQQIKEQPGVWGIDPTLDALQAGRLSVLVAPWQLDEQVWVCPNGLMAGTKQAANLFCDGDEPQPVALRDVIVDACAAYATRLEFVSGPAAEQLVNEMKGIAGLLRW